MNSLQTLQVPKVRIDSKDKAVLITGCDTGFGNMLARKLDRDGFRVYACCLFPLGEGAQKLKSECSSQLKLIKLDVTSDEDVDEAYETVREDLEECGKREYLALIIAENFPRAMLEGDCFYSKCVSTERLTIVSPTLTSLQNMNYSRAL